MACTKFQINRMLVVIQPTYTKPRPCSHLQKQKENSKLKEKTKGNFLVGTQESASTHAVTYIQQNKQLACQHKNTMIHMPFLLHLHVYASLHAPIHNIIICTN